MQLHDLKPTIMRETAKRIGRGGKRGTYSGRGIKGQKARAGHRIRPVLRDLLKKIPKRRGYRFSSRTPAPGVMNVGMLENRFAQGTAISFETLAKHGLITRLQRTKKSVKILGDGTITKALTIKDIPVSASAKSKIEAAGGQIINTLKSSD